MIGVRRVTPPLRLQHEMILMHQPIEPLTASHLLGIQITKHQEQLIGAYARSLVTNLTDGGNDLRFGQFLTHSLLPADSIITLATLAKQSTQAPNGCTGMPEPKVVYCLAPAFFSRSMPYCSRPIFNTSLRASLRSSE